MRKILSASELLDSIEIEGTEYEIMAEANAYFDEARQCLEVRLDTCLRPFDSLLSDTVPPKPAWLPKPTVQHESSTLEDSLPVTKDIFQSWVRRIRRALAQQRTPLTHAFL